MAIPHGRCPLTQRQIVERYFLEHRTQVLDIAAFLDRLTRAASADAERDFRVHALLKALTVLASGEGDYVTRVQTLLSDPDTDLLPAPDQKNADGACNPDQRARPLEV